MITAALAALPLISQVGQSVAHTLKQDLAGFLGLGQAGQNVPNAATSTAPAASQPASSQSALPLSFPALAESFRHDAASLLLTAQGAAGSLASASPSTLATDLIQAINPNGDGTISKTQFEAAFQNLATTVGGHGQHAGWADKATHLADKVFAAIDTNGDGSITADELTAYLGQVQSQGVAKYKVAQNLISNFGSQLVGATPTASPTTQPAASTSTIG